MPEFVHRRHAPPTPLSEPRELIVACAPLRSNINLSHIARAAGCCGVTKIICCGTGRFVDKIARDGAETVTLEVHRTLPPVLLKLREQDYQLVGLEQTTNSTPLPEFSFRRRSVLVVGNERLGLSEDVLKVLDAVVEIPVYGLPFSYNVAAATTIALYEYVRQFPNG